MDNVLMVVSKSATAKIKSFPRQVDMSAPRSRRSVPNVSYKEADSSFAEDPDQEKSVDRSIEENFKLSARSRERLKFKSPKVSHQNRIQEMPYATDSSDNDSPEATCDIPKHNKTPRVILEDLQNLPNIAKTPRNQVLTPRRGIRNRRKTSLAIEAEETSIRLKKLTVESSSDTEDSTGTLPIEKTTSLFTEDDVEGKKIFGFKMSHRKKDLLRKAIETVLDSPRTPSKKGISSTPQTPKSSLKSTPNTPKRRGRPPLSANVTPKSVRFIPNADKTPHRLRNKLKKKLQTLALSESEGSDFSESGSDFCPSDNEDSESISDDSASDKNSESNSDNDSVKYKTNTLKNTIEKTPSKPYSLRRTRGEKDHNFILKSDDYFSMHGNKKIVTSNRTLERLKTPRLTEDKLQTILKSQTISKEHKTAIKELNEDHERLFDKWLFVLSEGFSVLLYGIGSKEKLIQNFQCKKISSYPCIVINGFFPSLTLKDVLDSIIIDMLEQSSSPANIYEAVSVIENEMTKIADQNIFLLVHNIDGPMLRNSKIQYVLSKLAKIKNIHLIASVDYINAPLIWDHTKLSDYNFSWWDTTTFLPYIQETSYESSLLVHKSGALALSSMKNVFHSLTTNAKGIYMIIVKTQLKNKKIPHYQGISFKELYWTARESFLVSSDLALRAQLTEFLDHKLVKSKRSIDGSENLVIPIENALLQQFSEQNE